MFLLISQPIKHFNNFDKSYIFTESIELWYIIYRLRNKQKHYVISFDTPCSIYNILAWDKAVDVMHITDIFPIICFPANNSWSDWSITKHLVLHLSTLIDEINIIRWIFLVPICSSPSNTWLELASEGKRGAKYYSSYENLDS